MDYKVILKSKRADVLSSYRHPWVFSKGLAHRERFPAGTQVRVVSQDGRHLGWGFYHPDNPIALRMVTFEKESMDTESWRQRLDQAINLRKTCLPADAQNYRLIHGENDGFPGLTVDRFGPLLCLQSNSAGFEAFKSELAAWLIEKTGAQAVYERSEGHARKQEGLAPAKGFLAGTMEFPLDIKEDGFQLQIDPAHDQKTGFYLDQRQQRQWLEQRVRGKSVLDLCCYTGGFTLSALRGGAASVTSVDSSKRALGLLDQNIKANGLDDDRQTSVEANVFEWLKGKPEQTYDVVILDPPSLAKSFHASEKARKAYRAINRDVSRQVRPGGLLMSFSCTGVVKSEEFSRSVFLGLRDAKRDGLIIDHFQAGPDHPVNLCFPEGSYLKGLAVYLT